MSQHFFSINRCIYCGTPMTTGNGNEACAAAPAETAQLDAAKRQTEVLDAAVEMFRPKSPNPGETAGEMTPEQFRLSQSHPINTLWWNDARAGAYAKHCVEQAERSDAHEELARTFKEDNIKLYGECAELELKVAALERELADAHLNCPADDVEARAEAAELKLAQMREALRTLAYAINKVQDWGDDTRVGAALTEAERLLAE